MTKRKPETDLTARASKVTVREINNPNIHKLTEDEVRQLTFRLESAVLKMIDIDAQIELLVEDKDQVKSDYRKESTRMADQLIQFVEEKYLLYEADGLSFEVEVWHSYQRASETLRGRYHEMTASLAENNKKIGDLAAEFMRNLLSNLDDVDLAESLFSPQPGKQERHSQYILGDDVPDHVCDHLYEMIERYDRVSKKANDLILKHRGGSLLTPYFD